MSIEIVLAIVGTLGSLIAAIVVSILNNRSAKAAKKKSRENKKAGQQSVQPTGGIRPDLQHFSGFGFFLLSERISSRPPAANANRWAARPEKEKR
jgi:hypothetical protein